MTSSMKLGEAIYKAQQDTAGASKTGAKPDEKKDVVDDQYALHQRFQ